MVAQRHDRLARRFQEHENMVEFASRQILDMVSPSNFPLTNPEILSRTVAHGGHESGEGFSELMEDWERAISRQKADWRGRFRRRPRRGR